MGELLNKAVIFAVNAHDGQFRKKTNVPYILHPLETAAIVGTMTTDDEILAGAVLHDTVEDTDTTVLQIKELFGERVASLVSSESENKRADKPAALTWKIRKEETIEHLKTASADVKMITLGDKLSNIRSIHRDSGVLGDAVWQRFNQKDKNEHKWYYESIAECLTELKDFDAYREYVYLVKKTFE